MEKPPADTKQRRESKPFTSCNQGAKLSIITPGTLPQAARVRECVRLRVCVCVCGETEGMD